MNIFSSHSSISETFGICRSNNQNNTESENESDYPTEGYEDSMQHTSNTSMAPEELIVCDNLESHISINMSGIKFDQIVSNLDNNNSIDSLRITAKREVQFQQKCSSSTESNEINTEDIQLKFKKIHMSDNVQPTSLVNPSPTCDGSMALRGDEEIPLVSVSNISSEQNGIISKRSDSNDCDDQSSTVCGEYSLAFNLQYPPLRIGISKSYYQSAISRTDGNIDINTFVQPLSPQIRRIKPFGAGQYSFEIDDHEMDYVSGPHVVVFCHGFQGSPYDMKLLANMVQAELESVRVSIFYVRVILLYE